VFNQIIKIKRRVGKWFSVCPEWLSLLFLLESFCRGTLALNEIKIVHNAVFPVFSGSLVKWKSTSVLGKIA